MGPAAEEPRAGGGCGALQNTAGIVGAAMAAGVDVTATGK